uniref:Uncharacterized protein n=1 Tax=Anguilla anguilla TaxID=7936 RepID=A0A0E9S6R7_ANGAN
MQTPTSVGAFVSTLKISKEIRPKKPGVVSDLCKSTDFN